MSNKNTTILVTGLIGFHLLNLLLTKGYKVIGIYMEYQIWLIFQLLIKNISG